MPPNVRKWLDLPRLLHTYKRRMPLVLVNGLAEQPESLFPNRIPFSRHFDVKIPEILVYDGDALHQRIDSGGEVTVDYWPSGWPSSSTTSSSALPITSSAPVSVARSS